MELIQQHNDATSLYRDFLNAGHEGLQHIGYGTKIFAADLQRLLDAGYAIGHVGTVAGRGPFVYLLTEGHPSSIVELLDMSRERERILARIAEAAQNWDGKDLIRTALPRD